MDQYRALLTDTPHWALEVTVEIVTAVVISLPFRYFWKRWIERHDEQHHAGHTSTEEHS
jgi:membrane protein implicated in regulation of membrane protease activity